MRRGTTLLLALLVTLLGGYIYFVEQPALEREVSPRPLVEFDPDEIDRVELETPGTRIEIQRKAEGWQLVAPVIARADARVVDTLLRSVARAERGREIEATPTDDAPFGFAPPTARLRLHHGDETMAHLEVGSGTPIGFQTYVRRLPDPAILLTAGTLRVGMLKTTDDFRDRTILEIVPGEVRGLTLAPRAGRPTSLRFEATGWSLLEPEQAEASAARVRALLDAIRGMRAVEFVDERGPDAERRLGLSPPALHLLLQTADGPRSLRIGDPREMGKRTLIPVMVDEAEEIFLVPSHLQARLFRDFEDLRERPIIEPAAAPIGGLRLQLQGRDPILLERSGEDWSLGPIGRGVDSGLVERLLDDILTLTGDERFAERAPAIALPGIAPRLRIDILSHPGDSLGQLVFYPNSRSPGQFLVSLLTRGPIYTLPDHRFERIRRQVDELALASDSPIPAAP
jgi:hypothetical protein